MQMLILNRKIMLSIVTTMLLIYGVQVPDNVQAQNDVPELIPVSDRTQQVQDRIVALVPGVDAADDVTAAHLALITNLNLSDQSITALKAGDFDGLSALRSLSLAKNTLNSLPADIFSGLSALTQLDLSSNELSSLSENIFSGLSAMSRLNLSHNSLDSLSANTFSETSALTGLDLGNNQLSSLPAAILSGLSSLNWLSLSSNQLSSLPDGLFSGLSSLNSLYLSDNTLSLSIAVSLEKVGGNQFKATTATGAPFDLVLPITVTNGSIDDSATTVTIPAGSIESEPLTVIRTPGTSDAITAVIGTLPTLPTSHFGYSLTKPSSADNTLHFALGIPKPTGDPKVNRAPIFTEGSSTTRSIPENTPAGKDIGSPVSATDLDEDVLTYTLSGADAAAFGIVSTTGQLRTRAPLDYEQKNVYSVAVIVSDGNGGTDTIGVAINVTDVEENNAPVFIEGNATERSIPENTPAGRNIGTPVSATDLDEDVLTYSLTGVDAASFGIVSTTGQLRTRAPLDYEQKNTYSVMVRVSDGNGGTDTIAVTINVTDVNENNAPMFVEGTATERSIRENTPAGRNIGAPVSATDLDEDVLTYSLSGVDAASFGIVSTTGQLRTRAPLDYEQKNTYSVAVHVSDGNGGTDTIAVAINVTDVNETPTAHAPEFIEGSSTERSVTENTPAGRNIGAPVTATDEDEDVLTYTLSGVDAAAFGIVSATGQLQTRAPLDYEQKNAYSVAVIVSDGTLTDTISVAINVTDVAEDSPPTDVDETTNQAPVFAEGRTTRSIAENTATGVNIGEPVTATDDDTDDVLTYTLGGIDADAFTIVGATGQLKTLAPLDYEAKNAYAMTVTVTDGRRTDTITVIITVIDVDETTFAGGTAARSITENTPTGVNIGTPVSATNVDSEDVLIYSLEGPDADAFTIVGITGQLKTRAPLDYETKNTYTLTVIVTDGSLTASIIVTITIIDVDESAPPEPVQGEVTISEIMFATGRGFGPVQWIELHNSGTEAIHLRDWTMNIHNKNTPGFWDEPEKANLKVAFTFKDGFWGDAPTLFPNETVLVVQDKNRNNANLRGNQIYDLSFQAGRSFGDRFVSDEAFSIKLIDNDGNLVDEAGNYDADIVQWRLNIGHKGETKDGHRISMIRRYVNGVALDGTRKEGWIPAVDANLTADQLAYYGDKNDISTPGIGIVVNEIDSQFATYDANQDGVVNILDLTFIAGRFGESGPNSADVNRDGVVNIQDLILVAGALAQTQTAPSLHPTSLAMFTTADIQAWLAEAHGLDLTDPKLQRGIRFLEQLLSMLVPKETALLPNYPNPFNPETWIPYQLTKDADVTLRIYAVNGQLVQMLALGHQPAGMYQNQSRAAYWDGRNAFGEPVASGVYFYTLTAGEFTATRKMLIRK